MKCSKCKNPLDKNAKFCPICGTKVKKYRMRKILLRLLLLLVISVGVGIAGWKTGILDNLVSPYKGYVMEHKTKRDNDVSAVNSNESKAELYDTYLKASEQITDVGSWQEALNGDIDIDISSQDEKQNATIKATLESHANVSSFDAQNLSALKVSGDARIQAANESMAWSVEYSDGVAHCHYTEPTDYTADVEIDATYFNFYGLTEDMIQDASRTENEISFTIAG